MKILKKLNSKGFGHIEILAFLVVFVAIGGLGYYVYNKNVAHAASWTALGYQSLYPQDNTTGLSAVACKTRVGTSYLVQVDVSDTNPTFGYVQYTGYKPSKTSASGYAQLQTIAETTSKYGTSQQVNLGVPLNGSVTVDTFQSDLSRFGGYFYSTKDTSLVSGPVSSAVSGAVSSPVSGPGSGYSAFIKASKLTNCPGTAVSSPTSGAVSTPVVTPPVTPPVKTN